MVQPDSLAAAQAVANVSSLIASWFPDLSASVISALAPLILKAGPVAVALFATEALVAHLRGNVEWLHKLTAPLFDAPWKVMLINLILGAVFGGQAGSISLGSLTGLAWTAFKLVPPDVLMKLTTSALTTKATVADAEKAKTVALILGLGLSASLLAPHTASAGPRDYALTEFGAPTISFDATAPAEPAPLPWYKRPVLSFGAGEHSPLTAAPKGIPFAGVNVGWLWNAHISPRVEVDKILQPHGDWEQRASVWFVF